VQISLTAAQVHTLRDLLHDYLPELKLEVARTSVIYSSHAKISVNLTFWLVAERSWHLSGRRHRSIRITRGCFFLRDRTAARFV
jgi:hypothetical protein